MVARVKKIDEVYKKAVEKFGELGKQISAKSFTFNKSKGNLSQSEIGYKKIYIYVLIKLFIYMYIY